MNFENNKATPKKETSEQSYNEYNTNNVEEYNNVIPDEVPRKDGPGGEGKEK